MPGKKKLLLQEKEQLAEAVRMKNIRGNVKIKREKQKQSSGWVL